MSESIGLAAYHLFWTAVDWLYPPECGGCGKPGTRWCLDCANSVVTLDVVCSKCGTPLPKSELCPTCRSHLPPYTVARSWGLYEGSLRKAIHKLKYRGDMGLADALADGLIKMIQKMSWHFDMVTAVPLSSKRQKERGFNQSALLAKPLALAFRSKFQPGLIKRVKETPAQVGLNAKQRSDNMKGAFMSEQRLVKDQTILLIDDVMTTGATLTACTNAMTCAGAQEVFCLTLARAGLHQDLPA